MADAELQHGQIPRSRFVAGGIVAGGAALFAGLASGPPDRSRAQTADDLAALQLLLLVEYTENAFYRAALDRGGLRGQLRTYAGAVASQEREHLVFVRRALGAQADPAPKFEFSTSALGSDGFAATAAQLEDLAVAAYNGQATNVSRATLEAAAKIVSVEARHAAWIRSIVGEPPAPDATDDPRTADRVLADLERIGVRR
jgi:rubrerythrin